MRGRDGRLLEAERYDGELAIASASGDTPEEAWSRLRREVDESRAWTSPRVRVLRA